MRTRKQTIEDLIEASDFKDSEIVLNISFIRDLFNDAVGQLKDATKIVAANKRHRAHIQQLKADNARLREKDTPKPCEHKATLYKCLTCPSCSNVVSQHEMWGETEVRILPDYCKFCGQRIELPKEVAE